jgi:ubiquinone/menaquinone biosynthesis C-methylase UbiE
VVAIDGAASMLELAKIRLGELAPRVEWLLSEFQRISPVVTKPETFDIVISSYA